MNSSSRELRSHVRNANRTSGSQRKSRLCLSLALKKCSQDSSRTAKKKSVHSKETPNARTVQEENNNIEYPMLKSIGYFSFPRFLKKAWQKLLIRCSFNRYIFIRLDRQLNLCLKNLAKAFSKSVVTSKRNIASI